MLKLFHLLHDVHNLRTLHIHQTECGNVHAIVLKVLEIKCLDVLQGEKFIFGRQYVIVSIDVGDSGGQLTNVVNYNGSGSRSSEVEGSARRGKRGS